MEESSELKLRRVSFASQYPLPSFTKGRLEKMDGIKVHEHSTKEKTSYSSCYHTLEVPENPMEFLSRSWSPSASDFFHILSSNSLLLHDLDGNCEIEEHGERLEIEGTKGGTAQYKKDTVKRVGNKWSCLTTGRSAMWVLQRHRALKNNWMNMGDMKEWLRGRSLTSFSRRSRERKKEEIRLQTAKFHAALSIAQLAAAIAGFAAKGGLKSQDINNMASDGGAWDKKMGVAIASATALVASVCAEAAESVGAHRAHVASVINSGLATRTSADMITLTAAAATCLRGAEALNSRAMADIYFSKEQKILARGAKLSIHTPSGQTQPRMVFIYLKHNKLILRLGKKYFGGVLTTSKEYKIINMMEETKVEDQGFHSLALGTNIGTIKLLFEYENQSNVWLSTISHLLLNHNSYPIANTWKCVTV